jgi:hypothetical protein
MTGWVVLDSRKVAQAVVPLFLLSAALVAWLLWPWLRPEPTPDVPPGYLTVINGDMHKLFMGLDPPDPVRPYAVLGVNNAGKTVDSVLLKFSTRRRWALPYHPITGSLDGTSYEFRATKPLRPGKRQEYTTFPIPATLESVSVGWGQHAKVHEVAAALAASRRLIISYEPEGRISMRME